MTTPMTATDLGAAVRELGDQQDRVATLVGVLAGRDWHRPPAPDVAARLATRGHFGDYRSEASWTPCSVVGHLTDSARVFTERIRRILAGDNPWLPDFVPTVESLVASYATRDAVRATEDLHRAQAGLMSALRGVGADQLGLPATHEVDGPITLADIALFLPQHQRDHADQLESLVASR